MSEDVYELTVEARSKNLARIADFIQEVADAWSLTARQTYHVQMACDEACTNIIQHAYGEDETGPIDIRFELNSDRCVITIRDYGRPFDPDDVPVPDVTAPLEERTIGGLGLFFMRQLMDELHFEFDPEEGNLLTMVKKIEDEDTTLEPSP